jgi:hypothetical protein
MACEEYHVYAGVDRCGNQVSMAIYADEVNEFGTDPDGFGKIKEVEDYFPPGTVEIKLLGVIQIVGEQEAVCSFDTYFSTRC